jgi:hypothetical protein
MPSPDDPFEVLRRVSSNYESLANGFKSFHAGVARMADDVVSPIKQNTTVSNLTGDTFRVEFCGRAFEFQFRIAIDEAGPLGLITCSEVDGAVSNSFTFRPNGLADVEQPSNYTIPIAVNENASAIYLASRCLRRCIALYKSDSSAPSNSRQ